MHVRSEPARAALGPDVDVEGAAFIHPSALLYGNVHFGEGASMWPHAVIRAEAHAVIIGAYANVQDFVMVHVGYGCGTRIGRYTSIAHQATVHGATIGDSCVIGIGAIVMDGCVIGDNSIVGGGALVTEGMVVPANSIVLGAPAKVVKTRNNWVANRLNAIVYHRNAQHYARGHHRAWHGPEYEAFLASETERLEREFAKPPRAG